jgi:hypothetical protein
VEAETIDGELPVAKTLDPGKCYVAEWVLRFRQRKDA